MNINDQRLLKVEKIEELYAKRNTQMFIAQKFNMNVNVVGKVLRSLNYSNTRKKEPENLKSGELMNAVIFFDKFEFLDKYNMNNFNE